MLILMFCWICSLAVDHLKIFFFCLLAFGTGKHADDVYNYLSIITSFIFQIFTGASTFKTAGRVFFTLFSSSFFLLLYKQICFTRIQMGRKRAPVILLRRRRRDREVATRCRANDWPGDRRRRRSDAEVAAAVATAAAAAAACTTPSTRRLSSRQKLRRARRWPSAGGGGGRRPPRPAGSAEPARSAGCPE